jgi:hypothetical protein
MCTCIILPGHICNILVTLYAVVLNKCAVELIMPEICEAKFVIWIQFAETFPQLTQHSVKHISSL